MFLIFWFLRPRFLGSQLLISLPTLSPCWSARQCYSATLLLKTSCSASTLLSSWVLETYIATIRSSNLLWGDPCEIFNLYRLSTANFNARSLAGTHNLNLLHSILSCFAPQNHSQHRWCSILCSCASTSHSASLASSTYSCSSEIRCDDWWYSLLHFVPMTSLTPPFLISAPAIFSCHVLGC